MRCTLERGAANEKLVYVRFERAAPDTCTPTIRVIFAVHYPEGPLADKLAILVHLSATRDDTSQSEFLTDHEFRLVYQAAAELVAEEH